jgi:hypothetical protein
LSQAEENDFRRGMELLLESIERETNPLTPGPYEEGPGNLTLEHGTRRLFFDRLMTLLGWSLGAGGDVAEEVRIKAGTTKFIDYVGVKDQTNAPILILEAKAWDKPFIRQAPRKLAGTPKYLVVEAIRHINRGGASGSAPVISEWHGYLQQLALYVTASASSQYKHHVPRAVLASGQWLVAFRDPKRTFVDKVVSEDDIEIFQGAELSEQANKLHRLLSRTHLATIAPDHIRPTQLQTYFDGGQIEAVFRAVLVNYSSEGASIFSPSPKILVYPALLIQRRDGPLFSVVDETHKTTMDLDRVTGDETRLLGDHLSEVTTLGDCLLASCEAELGVSLNTSPVTDFPGLNVPPTDAALTLEEHRRRILFRPVKTAFDEWFIVTGEAPHYLRERPKLDCRFHAWSECRSLKMEVGSNAVSTSAISTPRAFFVDGSHHHCAHRTPYDRRKRLCIIEALDMRTCCSACNFETVCWNHAQRAELPCGGTLDEP